jgi:hypothetical protein
MRLPIRVPWEGGLGLVLSLLAAACADSPSDDLARAQTDLIRLEQQGAEAYLPRQMRAVQEHLRVASGFVQRNRFEQAGASLRIARAMLDSCATALIGLRSHAQAGSIEKHAQLQKGLDSLAFLLQSMPRQSYLDQNRHDVLSLRLLSMRQEALAMRQDIEQKNYPEALQRAGQLERRLRKSLATAQESFDPSVVVVSNNSTR